MGDISFSFNGLTISLKGKTPVSSVSLLLEQLFSTIKEQSQINTDGLLIQADGESSHQSVVKLMDEARNAGVTSISIVVL